MGVSPVSQAIAGSVVFMMDLFSLRDSSLAQPSLACAVLMEPLGGSTWVFWSLKREAILEGTLCLR